MIEKTIYRISKAGYCSRVLGAIRLGHEPSPLTQEDEERLEYYTWCEDIAARKLAKKVGGYDIDDGGICFQCKDKRHGFHVEIDSAIFAMVGHLDRKLWYVVQWLPVEIKSLGRFSYDRFERRGFDAFPEYAGQEACYLEAYGTPGIYWIMNRDTGETMGFIVNDPKNDINIADFPHVTLPVTFHDVESKINSVEICVSNGELPLGDFKAGSDSCRWCSFSYLCSRKEEEPTEIDAKDRPALLQAAAMYREAREHERTAEELKKTALPAFLARASTIAKFKVGGVSFSYRGERTREWLDEALLRKEAPLDLIQRATRRSQPYPDYTIRVMKED